MDYVSVGKIPYVNTVFVFSRKDSGGVSTKKKGKRQSLPYRDNFQTLATHTKRL
jgi:hypothetical protein